MRHYFLALVLVSSLSPAFASTDPVGAPCNLVDQDALVALNLGDHKTKEDHEKITDTKDAASRNIDTCTFTSQAAPFPFLTVTTTLLPQGVKTAKPSCSDKVLPGGADGSAKMALAVCTATVGNTFMSFVLMTNDASDTAMKSTFRTQIERLTDGLAQAGQQGNVLR